MPVEGGRGTVRRISIVLVCYLGAALIVMAVLTTLERVLFLPPLFMKLGRGGLALGLLVALILAWRYPDVGRHGNGA